MLHLFDRLALPVVLAKQHNLDIEASMALSLIPHKRQTAHAASNQLKDHLKSDDAYRNREDAPDHVKTVAQHAKAEPAQDKKVGQIDACSLPSCCLSPVLFEMERMKLPADEGLL